MSLRLTRTTLAKGGLAAIAATLCFVAPAMPTRAPTSRTLVIKIVDPTFLSGCIEAPC